MKLAAGIMSGTSLDGIDVVIAKISGYDENTKINVIASKTFDFPKHIKNKINTAMDLAKSNVQLITSLNFELGEIFANCVIELCNEIKLDSSQLDFIASHGQTIWHEPNKSENFYSSTLQIGSGAVISELTKTTVVSNFREKDIAAFGQGAPLVPFADEILFKNENKTIALNNLGGIANLTLLPKDKNLAKLAFDTGPANMMIDYAMNKLFDLKYDENGNTARSGKVIKGLYDEVMSLNYFNLTPPKSTGRELFGNSYTESLINKYRYNKPKDIVHTLTLITIDSIVNSYKKIMKDYGNIDEIIFSGGGVHNSFILDEIQKRLPNTKILKSSDYGIDVDYKEAIAFIILGNQTLNKRPANAIYATGAKRAVILGQINYY